MAIAFVPVRGGSKSIPKKNIKPLNGRPLVYWSLEALQNSSEVSKIYVATDSKDIETIVRDFKMSKVVIYERDYVNAQDSSSTESVILEFLEKNTFLGQELFILAQATSPLVSSEHFDEAIKLLKQQKKDSLLTVVEDKRFYWKKNGEPLNYDYKNRPRRQDFEGYFMENGAFYISKVKDILRSRNRISGNILLYTMPQYTGVEIDEPDDWIIIGDLMKKYKRTSINMKRNLSEIKLFLSDVDGTLTDSGMYYSENGDELKKFSTYDGKAFELLRGSGIKTGIITTESTAIVENRAKKMKVDYLYQGLSNEGKLDAAKKICAKEGIELSDVAYIGDDINCLELLQNVGAAACPNNAVTEVKRVKDIYVTKNSGGNGAVREMVDLILKQKT